MTQRKGLGKGLGMGYKNLVQRDPYIHSLSAKGIKTKADFVFYDEKTGDYFLGQPLKKLTIMNPDTGEEIKNIDKITYYDKQKDRLIEIWEGRGDIMGGLSDMEAEETLSDDTKEVRIYAKRKLTKYEKDLLDKYGDMYLADTEQDDIDVDDFFNWYDTYKHEEWMNAKSIKAWEKQKEEFEQELENKGYDFDEIHEFMDDYYQNRASKKKNMELFKMGLNAKGTRLNAIGKVWSKVVEDTLPHETRVRGKIANTLRDDEIETILGTMDFFGASEPVMRQAYSDMKIARFRVGDWLGMFIQNEGYDKAGGETATKVLAHAYIKADGNIDKMIEDLRVTDYQVDTSWEKIDLRELH